MVPGSSSLCRQLFVSCCMQRLRCLLPCRAAGCGNIGSRCVTSSECCSALVCFQNICECASFSSIVHSWHALAHSFDAPCSQASNNDNRPNSLPVSPDPASAAVSMMIMRSVRWHLTTLHPSWLPPLHACRPRSWLCFWKDTCSDPGEPHSRAAHGCEDRPACAVHGHHG